MKTLRVLRAMLLAGAVLASAPLSAGPAEDALAVQALLDAGKPGDAEAAARAALTGTVAAHGAESADAANLERLLGDALFDQKRYNEAGPHFQSALAVRLKVLGRSHLDTARSFGDLAANFNAAGDYGQAEPNYREALAIRTALLGADHVDVLRSLWRLALVIDRQGRLDEAASLLGDVVLRGEAAFGAGDPRLASALMDLGAIEADLKLQSAESHYRRALAIRETALKPGDAAIFDTRQRLAVLLARTGKTGEALALLKAAAAADEAARGPNHARTGDSLDLYAEQLMQAGRPDEAEPLFARITAIRMAIDGPASAAAADAMENHALALMALGRLAEAEPQLRKVVEIRSAAAGADAVTPILHLGSLVQKRGRPVEAEALYKRALDRSLKELGPDHRLTGLSQTFLGMLLYGQNRLDEAAALLERGVAIAGPDAGPERAALALLMAGQGKFDEAEKLFAELAAQAEKAGGAQSPEAANYHVGRADMLERLGRFDEAETAVNRALPVLARDSGRQAVYAKALSTLGGIRLSQKRYMEAETIFADVAARRTKLFGESDRSTLSAFSELALVKSAQGDDESAIILFERYVAGIDQLAAANAAAAISQRAGKIEDAAIAAAGVYDTLVNTYARLAAKKPGEAFAEKAFLTAQRVIESQAAQALAMMAARQAAGPGELASLLRGREERAAAWQRDDRKLTALRATAARDEAAETALARNLAENDAAIRAADEKIARDFPAYAAAQRPALPDFAAVQAALAEDEVLLFYADSGARDDGRFVTYLWAVPKRGAPRLAALERSTGEIGAAVRHMRGLLGVGGQARGAKTLGGGSQSDVTGDVLKAGTEIHKALLGPVEDMIAGKNLVIVPSRRLANLPFQLLVSAPAPAASRDRYRDAGWLVKDHALTVLPSVAALLALKSVPRSEAGGDPYLAFANPLLTGGSGKDRRAFARTGCAPSANPAGTEIAANADGPQAAAFFRGAAANVAAVRALAPLPETTDEVCAVAATLGAPADALRLGEAATEAEVKALSDSGALARARILHFATHGLVSGDLAGLAEPAIVLTPPDAPSAANDGLLTASEVAGLRIDADWVILSACNTASGEGGGEALSGLARAFFYSGARALMVSHWPVNSDAAVSLVTRAAAEIAAAQPVSRAEALRRAMIAEIEKGGAHADPANWAPFVLVGQ